MTKVVHADETLATLTEYRSFKVVSAAPILEYNTAQIQLDLGGGVVGYAAVEPDMFALYVPVPGDFYVVYPAIGDRPEYASISPKDAFEAGYALASADAPGVTEIKPADVSTASQPAAPATGTTS